MDGLTAGRVDRAIGESAQSILRINRPLELPVPASSEKALEEARDIAKVQQVAPGASKGADGDRSSQRQGADLEVLSDNLNKAFERSTGIRFQLSDDSGEVVIQVVDLQSEEVIRSIPSDRVAELKKTFKEFSSRGAGVLLDQRA